LTTEGWGILLPFIGSAGSVAVATIDRNALMSCGRQIEPEVARWRMANWFTELAYFMTESNFNWNNTNKCQMQMARRESQKV